MRHSTLWTIGLAAGLTMTASGSAHGPGHEWIGTFDTSWQTGGNWDPFGVPGPLESAYISSFPIGTDVTVVLDADTAPLEYLDIWALDYAAQLITNGHELQVLGLDTTAQAVIEGDASLVVVWPNNGDPGFNIDNLQMVNGASLLHHMGGITYVGQLMTVSPTCTVSGTGEVRLFNNLNQAVTVLDLDGGLTASNGLLTITALQGGLVDLDGTNTSISALSLPGDDVMIDAALAGPFGADARMFIGNGNRITFTSPVEVAGDVTFAGPGLLIGPHFDFLDGSDVRADDYGAVVSGVAVFAGGSGVDVDGEASLTFAQPAALGAGADIGIDGIVFFNDSTDYNGANIHGSGGHLYQYGDLNVFADTTVNIPSGYFQAGPPPTGIDIDVDTGVHFTINVLDVPGAIWGTTTVWGGVLEINTTEQPWEIGGTVTLDSGVLQGTEGIVKDQALLETIGFQDEVAAPLRVQSGGVIDVSSTLFVTNTLTMEGGWMIGTGSARLDGDVVACCGVGSLISVQNLDWDGSTESAHMTTVETDATLAISVDDIDNAPPPFFDGYDGSILVQPAGTLTVATNDGFWRLDGTLTLGDDTAVVNGDDVVNRGRVEGDGVVDASMTSTGLVAPGTSAGVVTVDGNYEQSTFGDLEIELGGPVAGVGYDVLSVSGTATLAGTLHVRLIDGYTPIPGQPFTVLTAGSRVGQFDTIIDQAGVGVSYTPTSVVLTYFGGASPADVDGSGAVDVDDLVQLFTAWGECPHNAVCPEDVDGDGDVDVDDLVILILEWS